MLSPALHDVQVGAGAGRTDEASAGQETTATYEANTERPAWKYLATLETLMRRSSDVCGAPTSVAQIIVGCRRMSNLCNGQKGQTIGQDGEGVRRNGCNHSSREKKTANQRRAPSALESAQPGAQGAANDAPTRAARMVGSPGKDCPLQMPERTIILVAASVAK
ncbi:hypothetical protein FRC12_004424 [Ceratobasidium sp. 428]|nr:hypothetical protein FRC12_004424 [Ceratobasidium sp. 428]